MSANTNSCGQLVTINVTHVVKSRNRELKKIITSVQSKETIWRINVMIKKLWHMPKLWHKKLWHMLNKCRTVEFNSVWIWTYKSSHIQTMSVLTKWLQRTNRNTNRVIKWFTHVTGTSSVLAQHLDVCVAQMIRADNNYTCSACTEHLWRNGIRPSWDEKTHFSEQNILTEEPDDKTK